MTTPVSVAWDLVKLDMTAVGPIEHEAEKIATEIDKLSMIVAYIDLTPAWEGKDSKAFIQKCYDEINALKNIYLELRACADLLRHDIKQRQERIVSIMQNPYAQSNDVVG
jgi:hypothetical protein